MYKCTMYAADNRPFKKMRTLKGAFFLPSYINCTSYIVPSYIYIVPSYIFLALFLVYGTQKYIVCKKKLYNS